MFLSFGGEEKEGKEPQDIQFTKYLPNLATKSHYLVTEDAYLHHGAVEGKGLPGIKSSFKNLEYFDIRLPCESYQSGKDNQEIFEGKMRVKYFMVLQAQAW